LMNPGMKENGGIFMHIQGWAVMAETMLGNGNRAYEYFRAYMPAAYNNKAEIREIEPYVLCQSTHSKFSPRYGASRIPWLTGSATWTMVAATQYILGIKPVADGLLIDPCIPTEWESFTVKRRFRGKIFEIQVRNPRHSSKGVKTILLNGEKIEGSMIPFDRASSLNYVTVEMV
nr:glycosyl transferase [Bacteroidales bacterium]